MNREPSKQPISPSHHNMNSSNRTYNSFDPRAFEYYGYEATNGSTDIGSQPKDLPSDRQRINTVELENDIGPIGGHQYGYEDGPDHLVSDADRNNVPSPTEEKIKHCHPADPHYDVIQKDLIAQRRLIIASVLCLIFMIGEAVGGFLASSLAILSDSAHLLTDLASFMISLIALHLATKGRSKTLSFGWHRAEIVGAMASIFLLWMVTGIFVFAAAQRIIHGHFEIHVQYMIITATLGVVVNIILGVVLYKYGPSHGHSHHGMSATEHQHGHSHGQGEHSHSHPSSSGKGLDNINVRAAFLHVMGDMIQSVGVLIAAVIIYLKPSLKAADPICTFLFSIVVIVTTSTIMRDIMRVIMEGSPKGIHYNNVKNTLLAVKGVKDVHNLRMWSLSLNRVALSVHLVCDGSVSYETVLHSAECLINDQYNIFEVTIQTEPYHFTMDNCLHCRDPIE